VIKSDGKLKNTFRILIWKHEEKQKNPLHAGVGAAIILK
jgi:hypothetical protein